MSKYKLPKHVRNFIKSELYNYEFNKKKLQEMQDDILHATGTSDGQPKGNGTSDTTYNKVEKLITSRSILIVTDKINKIERAFNKLSEDDQEVVDLIFFKGHGQIYAQMNDNISKDVYYNTMNKMIYLTAIEYGEV